MIESLATLPNLKSLNIDLQESSEAELVLSALPNLEVLNGQDVNHEDSEEENEQNSDQKDENSPISPEQNEPEEQKEINNEKLEEVVKIYKAFQAMRKKIAPAEDQALKKELKAFLIEQTNLIDKSERENPKAIVKNAAVLKAKHNLVDMTYGKLVEAMNDPKSMDIWNSIRDQQNIILERLLNITTEINSAQNEKSKKDKAEIKPEDAEEEKAELLSQIASLEEENKKYHEILAKRNLSVNAAPLSPPSPTKPSSPSKTEEKKVISNIY